MIALVDLHGAAVRVREDDPTSASSMLVLAKDPRLDLLQRRARHLERVDPKTDESAAAHAPARAATRAAGGKDHHTDTVELAGDVDETVAVVLVGERDAEGLVERDGLLQPVGENDDGRHRPQPPKPFPASGGIMRRR